MHDRPQTRSAVLNHVPQPELCLGELITDLMKSSYHTRMKADVGVDADPTFLEQEPKWQGLPDEDEYVDIFDLIKSRSADPAYNGYARRLRNFLGGQTDEWHQRFGV